MDALISYPAWRAFTDFDRFGTPGAAKIVGDLVCQLLLRRDDSSHA